MVVHTETKDTYEIEIKIAVKLIFTMNFLRKYPTNVLTYVNITLFTLKHRTCFSPQGAILRST